MFEAFFYGIKFVDHKPSVSCHDHVLSRVEGRRICIQKVRALVQVLNLNLFSSVITLEQHAMRKINGYKDDARMIQYVVYLRGSAI
jgi:hypothetical protein